MKKILLVAMCAVCALTVSAQSTFFSTEKSDGGVTFGLRAGLNFANVSYSWNEPYSEGNYSVSLDSRTTFHVGLTADIPLDAEPLRPDGAFPSE